MPGCRVPEGIGENAVHKARHRNLPTNTLMVEDFDEFPADLRTVVGESGHNRDFWRVLSVRRYPSMDYT